MNKYITEVEKKELSCGSRDYAQRLPFLTESDRESLAAIEKSLVRLYKDGPVNVDRATD